MDLDIDVDHYTVTRLVKDPYNDLRYNEISKNDKNFIF